MAIDSLQLAHPDCAIDSSWCFHNRLRVCKGAFTRGVQQTDNQALQYTRPAALRLARRFSKLIILVQSWETGLLGMCIGEKRRLMVPPSLGYGPAGVPKAKILPKLPVPPNAALVYDVELLGINGINVRTDDSTAQGTRVPYNYRDCRTDAATGRTQCGPNVPGRNI